MDETTIKTYNNKADEYTLETDDFWERFPSPFTNEFTKLVKGKVLDIGSGSGRDAKIFTDNALDVICLDASESMVKISKSRGFDSVVGNFLSLPFEDKSFDGVWAYTSLLHIHKNEIKVAINEIKRVLKDKGIFGLGLIEGEGEEIRLSMGEDSPRLFTYFQKKEVEDILSDCGFKEIYFEKLSVKAKTYLQFLFEKSD
ncbi:class I SAM-dependent methyltransferase [Patescibacteria group bacterium]|nr:class I SAM-dependent methyltransferase [Patescibacteria group bacterium]